MTKEEVARFKNQWDVVNQARIEEVRRMSMMEKINDLEILFEFGEKLGWSVSTGEKGWEYWRRLKDLADV